MCVSLQPICEVSLAQISDVDKAVAAAKEAFEDGEWGKMNPRDRGRLIYRSVLFLLTHPVILQYCVFTEQPLYNRIILLACLNDLLLFFS